MEVGITMAEYTDEFDDVSRALRTLGLIQRYGEVLGIEVNADVDIGSLLQAMESGEQPDLNTIASGDTSVTIQEGSGKDTSAPANPEDVIEYALSRDVDILELIQTAAQETEGRFYRLPPVDELGIDEDQYADLAVHIQTIISKMEDGESVTLFSEEGPPEHSGSSREGIEIEDMVPQGERKKETLEFLREHRGEWVNANDYWDWADIDRSTERKERSIASAALSRVDEKDWADVDTKFIDGKKYYKLTSQSGQDGEVNHENIPGQVSEGSAQHEALALLIQFTDEDITTTASEIADYVEPNRHAVHQRLVSLEDKKLAERVEEGDPNQEAEWQPTGGGQAEIDRIGGYQVN